MSEITVTISGPVGCGKSAIAGEIEIALRAVGVPVRFADEKEMHSEKNMTGADWTGYLEMYKPSVVIVEQTPWHSSSKCEICGGPHDNDALTDICNLLRSAHQ